MARRSDHTREELRSMILETTIRLIQRDGIEGATARVIAAEIGYSPGTIYNVYENLDDLMLHVAAHTLRAMRDEGRLAVQSDEPRIAMRELADFYFRFTSTHEQLWRVVTEHRLTSARTAPRWYRVLINEVLAIVDKTVAPLVGLHDSNAIRRVALTLWASMQGICTVARSRGLVGLGERIVPSLAEQLIETFADGLIVQFQRWSQSPPFTSIDSELPRSSW
jgi:AcrR family transcriptional regulator